MARTRPKPLRGFIDMMNEMERLRNVGLHGYETTHAPQRRTEATAWAPATDIIGHGRNLVIAAELARVPASKIDISVSDGVLTISGEREPDPEREAQDVTPYLRERYYGAFRRSVSLPDGVDALAIRARFDNGVVLITVPDVADASASSPHRVMIEED